MSRIVKGADGKLTIARQEGCPHLGDRDAWCILCPDEEWNVPAALAIFSEEPPDPKVTETLDRLFERLLDRTPPPRDRWAWLRRLWRRWT